MGTLFSYERWEQVLSKALLRTSLCYNVLVNHWTVLRLMLGYRQLSSVLNMHMTFLYSLFSRDAREM